MMSELISGPEVAARRLALGLSQAALADVLGVKQATVSRWEAGARVPGAGVDAELAVLEDQLEQLVEQQVRGDGVVYPAAGGVPWDVLGAVAAARAGVARRRGAMSPSRGRATAFPSGVEPREWRSLAAVARIRAEETRRHGLDFEAISDERWDAIADGRAGCRPRSATATGLGGVLGQDLGRAGPAEPDGAAGG
ncbi:helix-turn-helix domain-containing protein [Arsenicicoccus sp. UBA7492]|uniref:helix-turn-helix domain-containing protein n=1 Tax=Arsenicicoccus sp. UBA7492 TaxID=1946057 RepID=UPI00257FEF3B|nr:helix-turn-helix transcriptional regulator [Arsenicicoccus sp. UBA7492]